MAKASSLKKFTIYARGTYDTTAEITANSLEEAVTKARGLKFDDFVKLKGECCDYDMSIYGVYEDKN